MSDHASSSTATQLAQNSVFERFARAERDHGIIGRLIVTAMRNMSPGVSQELAELAVAYRHKGVVGFDLAGGELGHPARAHARAFEYARGHDLACTCHAGEGDGADSCDFA